MRRKRTYTEKRQYIIYALIRKNHFFVGITDHHNLRRIASVKINQSSHQCYPYMYDEHEKPCVFQLCVENQTISEAYRIKLAWIRILMEHGFNSIDESAALDAQTMTDATMNIYLKLKDRYDEMIRCENCCVKKYRKICTPNMEVRLHETHSDTP